MDAKLKGRVHSLTLGQPFATVSLRKEGVNLGNVVDVMLTRAQDARAGPGEPGRGGYQVAMPRTLQSRESHVRVVNTPPRIINFMLLTFLPEVRGVCNVMYVCV